MTVVSDETRAASYDLVTAAADYPPWAGQPIRSLLICSYPRSGSTLLAEALYFAGGLGCPLEYFHRGFRPKLETLWNTHNGADYRRAVFASRTDPSGIFSAKLFWRDVEDLVCELAPERRDIVANLDPDVTPEQVYREIGDIIAPLFPKPSFIHLAREDRVRQAVSSVVASQTRVWRTIPAIGQQPSDQAPDYDYQRIADVIGYQRSCNAHWLNFFRALHVVPTTITYEELTANYEATVGAVLQHLGRTARVPPARTQRQANHHSEAMVLQFLKDHVRRQAQKIADQ